jgi:plastocyanin
MPKTERSGSLLVAAAFAIVGAATLAGTGSVLAESHNIAIVDFAYKPATLTVFVGEPVAWTNNATRNHTVTSDKGTELDSGELGAHEGYGHIFETPGTYAYHCTIHPDRLKGTITVKAAPATATPSGSPEPTPPSGTLPPDFSPFPSAEPEPTPTPAPTASPTPAATPIPTDTTGGNGAQPILLVLIGAAAVGVVGAIWLRRRRTT